MVASSAHKMIKEMDFDDLQGEKGYDPFKAYALSKLGNILFAQALSDRLAGSGVVVNSLHPGVVATSLQKKSYDLEGISAEEGAATSVMLANSVEVGQISGKYFQNSQERPSSELSMDQDLQSRFWRVSEELVNPYLK
jgi:NAD(P)-dependent dehydrogenase (short-subunit alcohol dehydrogenase family)